MTEIERSEQDRVNEAVDEISDKLERATHDLKWLEGYFVATLSTDQAVGFALRVIEKVDIAGEVLSGLATLASKGGNTPAFESWVAGIRGRVRAAFSSIKGILSVIQTNLMDYAIEILEDFLCVMDTIEKLRDTPTEILQAAVTRL